MRKLRTIEMNRLTLEEFKEAEKLPLIVVLDDVRSLYNVGSVFRSCDAFRVEAVYLCGITATPPNVEIHKTALGGEDSVDWEYFKTTEEAVEKLKQKGYFVYSIEQVEGSTKLQNLPEAHPFLSTIDLLRMRKGLYFPYWMDPATKQRKPEFANSKPYE
jgi:tRNA G18 (ribose-2'-O)-methylase SpoU